jgi:hypothetical protein
MSLNCRYQRRTGFGLLLGLLLVGCTGDSDARGGNDTDLINEAKALEKRANDIANETVAQIEDENRDSLAEESSEPGNTEAAANATNPSNAKTDSN